MTLGQANPAAAAAPGAEQPSYLTDFMQAFQAMQQIVQSAKRQPIQTPPMTPGRIFKNFLSFGGEAQATNNYVNQFNTGVDWYNRGLDVKAAELANQMVGHQAQAQALQGRLGMQGMGLQLQIERLKELVSHHNWQRDEAEVKRQIDAMRPPTPGQLESGAVLGRVPDPTVPGGWRYEQPGEKPARPGTLGGQRAMPGSPAAAAGLGEPEPGGGAEGPPSPLPGENPADTAARRRLWEKRTGAAATAQGKATGELAAKARETQPILDQLDAMLGATDILPSGKEPGGLAQSMTGISGVKNWMRLKRRTTGTDIEKLRTLRAGDQLIQKMYRLDAVGVATLQDVMPYAQRLQGNIWKGREDAYNSIKEMRDFLQMKLDMARGIAGEGPGTKPTAGTPSTPGGQPLRSRSGRLYFEGEE
jgi:hypothetical protein